MPPVFGPASPSRRRLWSCDVASGSTCVPSTIAMKLASSPSRNSSMTTTRRRPGRSGPANMSSAACTASSVVAQITTPLPAARPSALTTSGARCARTQAASNVCAREGGVGRGRDAVPPEEILGEGLRAFEPRGQLARAEAAQARRGERVARCRAPAAPRARRSSGRSFPAARRRAARARPRRRCRRCVRGSRRCRHCRARRTPATRAATARPSRPARARDRRRR